MTAFLHAFLFVMGCALVGGGIVAAWFVGLFLPSDALMRRDRYAGATVFLFAYFLLTVASVAGIVAAVTP